MLKLHTFGTAYVASDVDLPLSGALTQRRVIALLSVLAVGGEGGVSRDRLLALLWPESDIVHARHALNQVLYKARRAARADDLFLSAGELRLNPRRIVSDVEQFDAALARDDLATAMATHRGPFLDGFFIPGSPEFEHWVAGQRARFADRAAHALARLALEAEQGGDLRMAVEWCKRLVDLNPFDSSAVARLMTLLVSLGDRAGALQRASVHEALLREQLDVAPDAEIVSLATRIKNQGRNHTSMVEPSGAFSTNLMTPHETVPSRSSVPERPERGPARSWRLSIFTTAIAFVLALASGLVLPLLDDGATIPPSSDRIMVAPFRVSGADHSLSFLREGMIELLAVRLTQVAGARDVDPGVLVDTWRANGMLGSSEAPLADLLRVATSAGAQSIVIGGIVGTSARIVLSASLVDVASGMTYVHESRETRLDSLSSALDQVAVKLLAAHAAPGIRLTQEPPPTLPALRAFLAGRTEYVRGNYGESLEHFERAIRDDSTFALASLHAALSADRLNDAEQHDRALTLAWTFRGFLSEPDRAHLVALAGPRYPFPSSESEQLAAWEQAARMAPDRADVWREFGERLFYVGPMIGVADWQQRSAVALERALRLDPGGIVPRQLLALHAAWSRDSSALAKLVRTTALRDSMGIAGTFLQWRVAMARGDSTELSRVRGSLEKADPWSLRAIAMSAIFDGLGVADGRRAVELRRAKASRISAQVDAILAQHSFALNQGRPQRALALTEQLRELQPGTRVHLRLRVLDALYGDGDEEASHKAASELARFADRSFVDSPVERTIQIADLCVLEQWRASRGKVETTSQTIGRLRGERSLRHLVPVATAPVACAELLSAILALHSHSGDAVDRVRALDSLVLTGPAMGDASAYAHIVVARAYHRLGHSKEALAAIRRRPYMNGWPRYLAAARRLESQLALELGDRDGARTALQGYLALRGSESTPSVDVDTARAAPPERDSR